MRLKSRTGRSLCKMADVKSQGILEEIKTLVCDKLQVVSYKWVSRNFALQANAAKRLLQQFAESQGKELEVVYSLSGWSRKSSSYCIKLVSRHKLEEAKQEYDGNCTVHVYSVQACIPKDPASLWNSEFLQAQELYAQPSTTENCLRDNRFGGIVNPFVKRNTQETHEIHNPSQPKKPEIPKLRKCSIAQESKDNQPSAKVDAQDPTVKDTKNKEDNVEMNPLHVRMKVDTDKKLMESGSLANMFGRARVRLKSATDSVDEKMMQNPIEAPRVPKREETEDGNCDDEGEDVDFKGATNGESRRKRRVIFDWSDDDEAEDTVNLSSPDLPKLPKGKVSKVTENTEHTTKANSEKSKDSNRECEPEKPPLHKVENKDSEEPGDPVACSPKRRKVMKTRIDERGREVTEVVWEDRGLEKDAAEEKAGPTITADTNTNRDTVSKKASGASFVLTNGRNKAGTKKGLKIDPKQGNILNFFKKA